MEDRPSVAIEATAGGLRWKGVQDGETVSTGSGRREGCGGRSRIPIDD